jgi:thiol-disulfide isomerase/thioredoxin
MKLFTITLVGGVVFMSSAAIAFGASAKPFTISVDQWVTPNPPSSEDMAGRVRVVELWATWCGPCRDQIPHMKALVKKYEDRNVVFIGLSEDQSPAEVLKFVEKKNINYHIGMDNGLSDRLGVSGIPTVFVISHDGRILWGGHPADPQFESALEFAVSAAPKPLLTGVELGKFSHLRIRLCGGKNFAKAYSQVESSAKTCDCSVKDCACKVFGRINEKLQAKLTAAAQMKDKDPQVAMTMYKEIVDNYSGIGLTKEAESAYKQLQRQITNNLPPAAPAQARADL